MAWGLGLVYVPESASNNSFAANRWIQEIHRLMECWGKSSNCLLQQFSIQFIQFPVPKEAQPKQNNWKKSEILS